MGHKWLGSQNRDKTLLMRVDEETTPSPANPPDHKRWDAFDSHISHRHHPPSPRYPSQICNV